MESRHIQLERAIQGLYKSDIPIVNYDGGGYSASGFTDDLGIYYFVPTIAKSLGLSVDQAVNLFLGSMLAIGAMVAFLCFFFTFKDWISRFFSFTAISLLTFASYRYSDVYIAFFFAITTIIPIFLLWKPDRAFWKLILSFVIGGILIGYCNFIRSHSGTGVFLFLISWLILNQAFSLKEKMLCSLALILSCTLPYFHFHYLEQQRDQFLSKFDSNHESIEITHPKWHSIYLGLGYLPNQHGIVWSDTCAWEKAVSIKPDVKNCSIEYETILKNQVFSIAKNDPKFLLKTILFKTLNILFRLLLFSNIGLLFYFYVRPRIHESLPFFISLAFFSLPGILVMPFNTYLAGFASISTLFGLYMICRGIEKRLKKEPLPQMNPL